MDLSNSERLIIRLAVERELNDLQRACLQDQGIAEGQVGTIGYELQIEYRSIIGKMRIY